MVTTKSHPSYRRLWALLLLPLMLVLASCEMKANTEFFEDETAEASVEMALPKAQANMFGMTDCEAMKTQIDQNGGGDDATVTDKSNDSELRCVISSGRNPISELDGDMKAEVKDGKYIVTAEGDESVDTSMLEGFLGGGAFSFTFTFPGKVESVTGDIAEDAYTIDGNKVEISNPVAVSKGFVITADATGTSSSSNLWLILGIILGLLVIGAIVFFILRGRKKPNGDAGAAPYGAPPAATDPEAPYGAPAPSSEQPTSPYGTAPQGSNATYGKGVPAENQPYSSPAAPDTPFSPYGQPPSGEGQPSEDQPFVAPADPAAPGAPVAPQAPQAPQQPVSPQTPVTPETPTTPETPINPGPPRSTEESHGTDPVLGFEEPRADGQNPDDPNRS